MQNCRALPQDLFWLRSVEILDAAQAHLLELALGLDVEAAENHRQSLKNPAKTMTEYIDIPESKKMPQTASVLREYMVGDES